MIGILLTVLLVFGAAVPAFAGSDITRVTVSCIDENGEEQEAENCITLVRVPLRSFGSFRFRRACL